MFQYEFMRLALGAGLLLSIIIPLVGSTNVYKRLSMSGDALAHTSLAGVAVGLASGLSPLVLSIAFCVGAFLVIEILRKRFPRFSELGVAVVLSLGIGVAGIASSFASSANFDAYLFGSILLIGWEEIIWVLALFIAVIAFYSVFYWSVFAVVYDEEEAKIAGLKVNAINYVQSLLTALTIAISAKIIGSLIVSSLLVVPVASALSFNVGYRKTMIWSIVFSFVSMMVGLTLSFYFSLRPGAAIVIVSIVFLVLSFSVQFFVKTLRIRYFSKGKPRDK